MRKLRFYSAVLALASLAQAADLTAKKALNLEVAKQMAREIASKSPIAVRLAKEAIMKTYDMTITEGLQFERKNFYTLFSSQDQKEGMHAFMEKRPAKFLGR